MSDKLPVYLLAGRGRGAPDPLVQAVLRESGVPSPLIAYVGTASGDDKTFLERITNIFRASGSCRVEHALILPRRADLKKAQKLLKSADIVFISGGDVEAGMEGLQEKGMVEFLVDLYRQGKLFFGMSAGSIMLGEKWVRWRDPDDDATAELFPCLGIASVMCDTHDEDDDWGELKDALKLEQDGSVGYGIASGTAIKVNPDGKVEALGGAAYRFRRNNGKVSREDVLPSRRPV